MSDPGLSAPAPQFRAEWPALRKRMSADENGSGRAGATKRRIVLLAVLILFIVLGIAGVKRFHATIQHG